MEPHLYAELVRMKKSNTFDWFGLCGAEIDKSKKRMEIFTVREYGEQEWKGSTVPTLKQVEDVLQTQHYRIGASIVRKFGSCGNS